MDKASRFVRRRKKLRCLSGAKSRKLLRIFLTGALLVLIVMFIRLIGAHVEDINSAWLYGSVSYEKGEYGWQFRVLSFGAALMWLVFLLLCVPAVKLPYLSYIGANTMPVYLLHGFVIKFLSKIKFFKFVEHDEAAALFLGIVLVAVLSWRPLVAFLSPLFRWNRDDFRGNGGRRLKKNALTG